MRIRISFKEKDAERLSFVELECKDYKEVDDSTVQITGEFLIKNPDGKVIDRKEFTFRVYVSGNISNISIV